MPPPKRRYEQVSSTDEESTRLEEISAALGDRLDEYARTQREKAPAPATAVAGGPADATALADEYDMIPIGVMLEDEMRNTFMAMMADDCVADIRGHAVVKDMEEAFRVMHVDGQPPSAAQRMMMHHYLATCLPAIYGEEWAVHREFLLLKFKVDNIAPFIVVFAPRRMGKTQGVSMFLAALLFSMPNAIITVFANGKKAAVLLMQAVKRYLLQIFQALGTRGKIEGGDADRLRVEVSPTDMRILETLSGDAQVRRVWGDGGERGPSGQ